MYRLCKKVFCFAAKGQRVFKNYLHFTRAQLQDEGYVLHRANLYMFGCNGGADTTIV